MSTQDSASLAALMWVVLFMLISLEPASQPVWKALFTYVVYTGLAYYIVYFNITHLAFNKHLFPFVVSSILGTHSWSKFLFMEWLLQLVPIFLGLLRLAKFRLRLIQCNDKTFILATMDVQTSVTTQRCLDGTPKGAASFRWFKGKWWWF